MAVFTNENLVVNPGGVDAVNIQDGGNSITVDGAVTSNIGTTGGLALDATLTGGTQTTRITDGTDTLQISVGGAALVDGSAVTQPISAVSLPLPTGAATEATLATRLSEATFIARINTLGQKTMAASTPVVIASDQSAIPVTFGGVAVATVTSVPVSTTVATLSASNAAKTRVIVHNEAGTLFVKLGSGATSASYSYRLTANSTLEIEGYYGIVTAIKAAGSTDALVTEVGI